MVSLLLKGAAAMLWVTQKPQGTEFCLHQEEAEGRWLALCFGTAPTDCDQFL